MSVGDFLQDSLLPLLWCRLAGWQAGWLGLAQLSQSQSLTSKFTRLRIVIATTVEMESVVRMYYVLYLSGNVVFEKDEEFHVHGSRMEHFILIIMYSFLYLIGKSPEYLRYHLLPT